MNQQNIILIEAGTPDFNMLKRTLERAEETGTYIRFFTEQAEVIDGKEYQPALKVKAYEGEWTPGITSHRPNGGY